MAFSPDGKTIVSGSGDQTLIVWGAGACTLTPSIFRGRDDTNFTVDLRVNDTGEIIGQNAHGDEVAPPTKKQRVNDEQWFTEQLEQAKSRIKDLQEELADMEKYKNDLVAMLNKMGVDNKTIAEHLTIAQHLTRRA